MQQEKYPSGSIWNEFLNIWKHVVIPKRVETLINNGPINQGLKNALPFQYVTSH